MSDAPLSRPLAAATVQAEGFEIEITADAAERSALASLNEVEAVERLTARLVVRHAGRDGLAVTGVLYAQATRLCVTTLEPFVETVREEVDVRFAPETADASADEDEDPPYPIVAGQADLGLVVAEFFTLGLDPHPRKPGASFEAPAEEASASPFAKLLGLKSPEGQGE